MWAQRTAWIGPGTGAADWQGESHHPGPARGQPGGCGRRARWCPDRPGDGPPGRWPGHGSGAGRGGCGFRCPAALGDAGERQHKPDESDRHRRRRPVGPGSPARALATIRIARPVPGYPGTLCWPPWPRWMPPAASRRRCGTRELGPAVGARKAQPWEKPADGARNALASAPLDDLRGQRAAGVVPDHAPSADDIGEFHVPDPAGAAVAIGVRAWSAWCKER